MPLVLYILRLLLGLLVGWWRGAAPLVVRKDGRVQTWTEDDAAQAAVGQVWGFLPSSRAAPPRGAPPRPLIHWPAEHRRSVRGRSQASLIGLPCLSGRVASRFAFGGALPAVPSASRI